MSLYPAVVPDTLEVCGSCHELRGAFEYTRGDLYSLVQRCRCDHQARLPDQIVLKWPIFEYNTVAELCRCCGAVALPSGTRWSVWFCATCKPRAMALNHKAGRPALPIGRHSLMHGTGLRGIAATSARAQAAFFTQCGGLFTQQQRVGDWAREAVRRNLDDLGLGGKLAVPLPEYATAARSVSADQRLAEMLAWFATSNEF